MPKASGAAFKNFELEKPGWHRSTPVSSRILCCAPTLFIGMADCFVVRLTGWLQFRFVAKPDAPKVVDEDTITEVAVIIRAFCDSCDISKAAINFARCGTITPDDYFGVERD